MPEVFFTTNPAEWTKLEGLYVSERKNPGVIKGVDLSTTGLAGKAVRGPKTPQLMTNTARILEVYGGRSIDDAASSPLYGEMWRALANKPFGPVVMRRIYAADALAASFTFETAAGGAGTNVVRIDASSPGTWANGSRLKVKIEAPSDGVAGKWNLRVSYLGKETVYANLDTRTGTDNLLAVIGEDIGNTIVATKIGDGTPVTVGMAGLDADGFIDIGETVGSFTSVAGSDGTLVSADYLAALADLTAYKGLSQVLIAEASVAHTALNGSIVTQAPTVSDRVFLTWSGIHGQAVATEITSKTTDITTVSDRIVWCFNSAKMLDPATGLKIDAAPHHWMAAILSQWDVDIHPGSEDTMETIAGILELRNETLSRADLISLRNAGICALEKVEDGFKFHSGVCTDNTAVKSSEITTRRSRDFLQLSASSRLKSYVKAKSTVTRRKLMVGELESFSADLKDNERIIEEFEVKDNVTTTTEAAAGLRKILWRVRLIGHLLFLVLETDIGTGVTIEKAA